MAPPCGAAIAPALAQHPLAGGRGGEGEPPLPPPPGPPAARASARALSGALSSALRALIPGSRARETAFAREKIRTHSF